MPSATSILRSLLEAEARITLRRRSPRVVVVTGSAGKTGAKAMITPVIGLRETVRASGEEGNHLLTMAVLGQPPLLYSARRALATALRGAAAPFVGDYPRWLVLEVDASAPGRSSSVAGWLRPEVVVFTALGESPAHLEEFRSREHLIDETTALCASVVSGGALIVNADETELLRSVTGRAENRRIIRYGFSADAEVRATAFRNEYTGSRVRGTVLELEVDGVSTEIHLAGVIGAPVAYAALAAAAVGRHLGLPLIEIAKALASAPRPPGRLRLLEGVAGATLIDDTWNPSPPAWSEAMRALASVRCEGRRVAIVGGMRRAGDDGAIHAALGTEAAAAADLIIACGPWATAIADGARTGGGGTREILVARDAAEAAAAIRDRIAPHDVILVTAADSVDGIGMEHAVERLLLRPEEGKSLLVRQVPWWRPRR